MPAHTPHREQCRNCVCPQGNHLHNPIDNLTAELCKCFCHQYCDCEICLPPKVEEVETFDANCAKSDVVPDLLNQDLSHYGFKKPPDKYDLANLRKINEAKSLANGGIIHESPEIKVGNKVFSGGQTYTIVSIYHDPTNKYSVIESKMDPRPEDPEVCHACDCITGAHIRHCVCSCHVGCDCSYCDEIKNKVKRVMALVKENLSRKKNN